MRLTVVLSGRVNLISFEIFVDLVNLKFCTVGKSLNCHHLGKPVIDGASAYSAKVRDQLLDRLLLLGQVL